MTIHVWLWLATIIGALAGGFFLGFIAGKFHTIDQTKMSRAQHKRQDTLMNLGNRIARAVRAKYSWANAYTAPLGGNCQVVVREDGKPALLLSIGGEESVISLHFRSQDYRGRKTYTIDEVGAVSAIEDVIKFLR